jgi:recombination protein RecT
MTAVAKVKSPEERALVAISERMNRGSFQSALADLLPKHIAPVQMIRTALLVISKRQELLKCTPESLAQALLDISVWGLEVGRTAHIVAFGSTATAMQDWKGMVERAIRANAITTCRARLVYERDEFVVEYGLHERLVHTPHWREKDRGEKVGVYAVATLPTGEQKFELMNAQEVLARRARSTAFKGKKGPWLTDEDEMWKKTVVRNLLKGIPASSEIAETDDDERLERFAQEHGWDGTLDRLSKQPEVARQGRANVRGSGYDADPEAAPTVNVLNTVRQVDDTRADQCAHGVSLDQECVECQAEQENEPGS